MYDWVQYTIAYATSDRNGIDNPNKWEWQSFTVEMEDGDFQIDDLNCGQFLRSVSKSLYIVDCMVVNKTVTKHHLTDYDWDM